MIYDRATTALIHCFLLGGVAIGEAGLLVLSLWCLYWCYKGYKEQITVAGPFSSSSSSSSSSSYFGSVHP
jgi:hypothetical protein